MEQWRLNIGLQHVWASKTDKYLHVSECPASTYGDDADMVRTCNVGFFCLVLVHEVKKFDSHTEITSQKLYGS